jgi:hypothetical protein
MRSRGPRSKTLQILMCFWLEFAGVLLAVKLFDEMPSCVCRVQLVCFLCLKLKLTLVDKITVIDVRIYLPMILDSCYLMGASFVH